MRFALVILTLATFCEAVSSNAFPSSPNAVFFATQAVPPPATESLFAFAPQDTVQVFTQASHLSWRRRVGFFIHRKSRLDRVFTVSNFENLPSSNYVIVANHVNRFGLDGVFIGALIKIITGRSSTAVHQPFRRHLHLLQALSLVKGSGSTTARAVNLLRRGKKSIGFFLVPKKSESGMVWRTGHAFAAVQSGKPVVLLTLQTTMNAMTSPSRLWRHFKSWVRSGFSRWPSPFRFDIHVEQVYYPTPSSGRLENLAATLAQDIQHLMTRPGVVHLNTQFAA